MKANPPNTNLGMSCPISRRDFVNGVLIGSGAALLSAASPAGAGQGELNSPSGSSWTGYGGVGDYRWSNGNTEAVRDAAHGIRDHRYPATRSAPIEATHDVVIIGGGFSGLTAAYELSKHLRSGQTCLLLENHPMVGGEAKQNEFDVDGQRLVAPQGSNGALVVKPGDQVPERYRTYADYYRELGMPSHYELEPLAGGAERYTLPNDHFDPMLLESRFAAGYYFRGQGWVRNPIAARFAGTPWPAQAQRDLDDFVNNRRDVVSGMDQADRQLDSMTYYELLDKLQYGPQVRSYIDPLLGVGNFGMCGNAVSAYAAKRLTLPGTIASNTANRFAKVDVVSFPGGNAAIYRKMLSRLLPECFPDTGSLKAVAQGPMRLEALDRPGAASRIRLGATAVRVRHDGDPASAGSAIVTYVRDGKLHDVRARAVVLGCGGWVTRNIVTDLPEAYANALREFRYGPVLTANVAVRNWRFFDKLGFTVARWFQGLGWHLCVRRNVAWPDTRPLTPDSPIVLTFYIPFLFPQIEPAAQGSAGRGQLLGTSYAQFEMQIREQMSEMFASAGFDARRDIAAIVLNRWGHAYFSPPLNFFFGRAGGQPPHELLRQPHGRIIFAHSELQGNMNMAHAMLEGRRGALQALELIAEREKHS